MATLGISIDDWPEEWRPGKSGKSKFAAERLKDYIKQNVNDWSRIYTVNIYESTILETFRCSCGTINIDPNVIISDNKVVQAFCTKCNNWQPIKAGN